MYCAVLSLALLRSLLLLFSLSISLSFLFLACAFSIRVFVLAGFFYSFFLCCSRLVIDVLNLSLTFSFILLSYFVGRENAASHWQ